MAEKDFLIGCDPEFILTKKNGNIIESWEWTNLESDFGMDGSRITFEARPRPSKDPLEVVYSIQDIFSRQILKNEYFNNFNWYAGSYYLYYPLGGHIHFGLKNKISGRDSCPFLNNYVGSISLLVEKQYDARKRRYDGYGRFSDYRPQTYGFEYRALSSWLVSPHVSAAFLCLSKTVMFEVLNNPKFKWNLDFVDSITFNKVKTDLILEKFPLIWSDVTKMKLYQTYKPYIDILYFLVKNNLTWFPKEEFTKVWGLKNLNRKVSKKINIEAIWLKYNNYFTSQT